ncbi:MAG: dTMP kinase [Aggregatilineales bacterium]
MTDAFFLVLEGLDGSGKSAIARRLAALLNEALAGRALPTFEPHDDSAAGTFIREVLAKRIPATPRTLALAFALNRADHNTRVIGPFLEQGGQRVVVCDRYYLSSLVYQSTETLSMEEVLALNVEARRPDLTLFLDASPQSCYARMGLRGGDRELYEHGLAEQRAKYRRAIALLRARGEAIIAIDADPPLIEVLNQAIDALNAHAPVWMQLARQPAR